MPFVGNSWVVGRQGISDCMENVMPLSSCPNKVAHRFQGSGRGGRDGQKCVSVMFSDQKHLAWLRNMETVPRGTLPHGTADQSPESAVDAPNHASIFFMAASCRLQVRYLFWRLLGASTNLCNMLAVRSSCTCIRMLQTHKERGVLVSRCDQRGEGIHNGIYLPTTDPAAPLWRATGILQCCSGAAV